MLLDELVVRLSLDSKEVESKAGSATKKLDDIEKSGKAAEEGVKGIGKASKDTSVDLAGLTGKLGAFLALLGGTVAIKTFIRDAIDTNTQLSFLSRNLGIDAQSIFAWSTASQELGGSAAGLQGTLKMLSQEGANLAFLGESRLIPFFSRMRIALPNPQDPNGPTTALRQMAEYAERAMKLGATRTTMHNWFAEFIPDEGTINLILQGTAALDAAQVRSKRWAPTDNELRNAVAMKAALVDLEAQFVKIGYDVLQNVSPTLESFFGWLKKIGAWMQQNSGLVTILLEAAGATAALGAIIAAVTSPLLAYAAAFTAVAAGILLMYDDYKVWKSGGMSEFDWTRAAHDISLVGDAFDYVGNKIEWALDWWNKWQSSHNTSDAAVKDKINVTAAKGTPWIERLIYKPHLEKLATAAATKFGVDPELVKGVIGAESSWDWNAVSSKGAKGLMQLMDSTAKQFGVTDPYDSSQNINAGTALLKQLLDKYGGNIAEALSAYNSGDPHGGSKETRDYVSKIMQGLHHTVSSGGRSQGGISPGERKEVRIAIAQMNIHTQAKDGKEIADTLRGMDWLKWAAPANGASQ